MGRLLKSMLLQQSLLRSAGNAPDRNVRALVLKRFSYLEIVTCARVCCSAGRLGIDLRMCLCVQEAGTSRAGGGFSRPRADPNVESRRTDMAPPRTPQPQARTARSPQPIALNDGDRISSGYTYAVDEQANPVPSGRIPLRSACDTVDLITPPKAAQQAAVEAPDTAKSRANAKRNLTRNLNRKANATFAKEMKDSLAGGRPTAISVAMEQIDLRGAWHTAAKEVAYKYLDLRKESWKDYTIHDKGVVHKELLAQFSCDPPLDTKRIDKYLSGHLRTSRGVWKAHWKRYGSSKRHPKCPEEAWESLTAWWPTEKCREEAAEMASRRARVERTSKVGRNSLMERMDVQVSNNLVWSALEFGSWLCFAGCACMRILQ